MRTLSVDIETYSSVSIKDCGAYKYAESPDFEILLFGYSVDFAEPEVIDIAQGEDIPLEIVMALFDPNVIKTAYNAQFEWICLSKYFGLDRERSLQWIRQWRDTMIHAYYLGYAGSLEMVGKAVGLPEDKQKLSIGKALIRYFSCPVKPTKSNGQRTRNYPHHDPEKWELYKEYNRMDVVSETNILQKLMGIPVPEFIWEQWFTDIKINSRGVPMDHELIVGAIECDRIDKEKNMQAFRELTGLANPASNAQLLTWLHDEGLAIENMQKATIADTLKRDDLPDHIRRALELKQEVSKTSIRKFSKMLDYECADGRARGILQFYGASTTGRYSGRGIQLHNLKRCYLSDLDTPREIVKQQTYAGLNMFYESVSDTLSQLIRTAFIPAKGEVLLDADFSAIEARVIAWLAGEDWVLEEFRGDGKIYEATASQMFGVPKELIKKGSDLYKLRQQGKVSQLACIAENELVLTDKGLVPIQDVTTYMKVWDGEDWVSHEGVIYKGEKNVIEYEGLRATEGHIVWDADTGKQIPFGQAAESGSRLVQSGSGGRNIRVIKNINSGTQVHKRMEFVLRSDRVYRLRRTFMEATRKLKAGDVNKMSKMFNRCKTSYSEMARWEDNCAEAEMHKSIRPELSSIRRSGNRVPIQLSNGVRVISHGLVPEYRQIYGNRSNRHKRALRKRKPENGYTRGKSSKQKVNSPFRVRSSVLALRTFRSGTQALEGNDKRREHRRCERRSLHEKKKLAGHQSKVRVYDIRNAGPHHRFTVSGKLVHNCSYGGGVNAITTMDFNHEIPDEMKPGLVEQWREANPNIVRFWYQLERACKDTIKTGASNTVNGKLKTELVQSAGIRYLRIVLPNGRAIYYCNPRMTTNRFGNESIGFMGKNQVTGKWEKQETYSGKLAENVTQSVARDLLAESIERLEAEGFHILFHIHDEVVITYGGDNPEEALERVYSIMSFVPPWAEGLPMAADGWIGMYFKKD